MEPIDPDVLQSALREHQTLPLRSESHKSFAALFVDADQLHLLDTPDWQVVYGRRGTGKTLLLKTREEHLLVAPAVTRVLPLYVSMQDAIASPPVGLAASDRQRAYATFQLLIERLADEIAAKADTLVVKMSEARREGGLLMGALTRFSSRPAVAAEQVDSIVRELLTFMLGGDLIAAFADASFDVVEGRHESSARGYGARVSARAAPHGLGAGVEAHASVKSDRAAEVEMTDRRGGEKVPRFPSLRAALVELAEALDVDRVDILIDEWSVLDLTGTTTVQPRVAALLRRALFGTPRVTVKIATNRYNSIFEHRGVSERYGLEVGADIFEAINLDRAFLGRQRLAAFYEELLWKRLLLREPRLSEYTSSPERPGKGFALALFEDEEAFEDLVNGCEAVPRDFIVAFRNLAQWSGYSADPRWSRDFVQDAVVQLSIAQVEAMEYGSDPAKLLERGIKLTALETGRRLFLIPRDVPMAVHSAIALLLDARLIHEYVGRPFPADVRERYLPYCIAYGIWWDWERIRQRVGTPSPDDLPDLSSDEDVMRFVVPVDQVGIGGETEGS